MEVAAPEHDEELVEGSHVAESGTWRLRGVFWWGLAIYLAATAALTAAMLDRTGGRLVYVADDPIIHLSVADNLLQHGTWGVEAGHFESASSSPLWTALLVPVMVILPISDQWLPLVLNLVAAGAVLAVLDWHQQVLRPSLRRPLDLAGVAVIVVVAGFLPGLAITGMEHTLHAALVIWAACLISRNAAGRQGRRAAWLPVVVLATASLVRFETLFVAAGLAIGLLVAAVGAPGAPDRPSRGRLTSAMRRAAVVGAAGAVPVAAFAIANRAMGGGWLPNSVLAKGRGAGTEGALRPLGIARSLIADPLLVALFLASVGIVVVGWRRSRAIVLASTMVVATLAHVTLADLGWFERYQAYLILLGIAAVLEAAAELPPFSLRPVTLVLIVALLVLAVPKLELYPKAPRHAAEVEGHHLTSARFLRRYYNDRPIGIDQLGYVSYLHDGPTTDFFGLGDYEALSLRRGGVNAAGLDRLARTRGFRIAVTYEVNVPATWVLVGDLVLRDPATFERPALHFYATVAEDVLRLRNRLVEFETSLPAGVDLEINELAILRAEAGG